jgi:hypothetical protein
MEKNMRKKRVKKSMKKKEFFQPQTLKASL